MSKELKIYFSEYNYMEYLANTLSSEVLKGYKNKLVLFRENWNDFQYKTLFFVTYFNDDRQKIDLGEIKICNKDLTLSEKDKYDITKFLKEDNKFNCNLDIQSDSLSTKYISIIYSDDFYDKLVKIFDEENAHAILLNLREISTINDNKIFEQIEDKDWYNKSLTRYLEEEKIVEFTKLKNNLSIESNTYQVINNLLEYRSNIETQIDDFYNLSKKYIFEIKEAEQILCLIKFFKDKDSQRNKELEKQLLEKLKIDFKEYLDFVKEIDGILSINEEFYNIVENIKEILRVKEKEINTLKIGHYTSLTTMYKLINDNNPKDSYLRLTNGRQMNDPLEGRVLLDYLTREENNLKKEEWKPTFWYVSSATSEMDSLPMWKQYGEDASGVMLVYSSNFIKEIFDDLNVDIYKVAYIKINEDKLELVSNENIGDDERKNLEENIKKLKEMNKSEMSIPVLSNLSFLFKKSDYAYESEYRIVIDKEKSHKKISVQNGFDEIRFLYVYLEKALQYSNVILGPKSKEIDYIAPYIHYCDRNITIEKSQISFR